MEVGLAHVLVHDLVVGKERGMELELVREMVMVSE